MTQFWIDGPRGKSVCVTCQNGHWSARLYVNGRDTITLVAWKGKTEAGARKFAAKALAS